MSDDEVGLGRRLFVTSLLISTLAIVVPCAALADRKRSPGDEEYDDDDDDDDDDDHRGEYGHEAARRARAAGEIAPLSEIIDQVKKTHDGDVVGVELEREAGRWVYEIKLITPKNRFLEIYMDARDGTILAVEGE